MNLVAVDYPFEPPRRKVLVACSPHSIHACIRLQYCYYAFRNFKLSGAGRMQAGHPSSRLGGGGNRRPAIQTERFVDFGGRGAFGHLPRHYGHGVFLVD